MPHLPMHYPILDFMKCEVSNSVYNFNYSQYYHQLLDCINNIESSRPPATMDANRCVPNIGKVPQNGVMQASDSCNYKSPDRRSRNCHLNFCAELPRTPKRPMVSRIPKNQQKHLFSLLGDTCVEVGVKKYNYQSPNVNPLMVASKVRTARKRKHLELEERSQNLKALLDMLNNSEQILYKTREQRFSTDFEIQRTLGEGSFGSVYLVRHRLDGVEYAVKQCKQVQFTGTRNTSCLREVWALSCVAHHDNIVRYYCSWAEHDYLYIQLEYCNGSSLSRRLAQRVTAGREWHEPLCEDELRHLLHDIASALDYLHQIGVVHLDVKPDNVLISVDEDKLAELTDINGNADHSSFYARLSCTAYKLADFGLATCDEKISHKCPAVEDGDKYYLPQEILSEDYSDLSKADLFSLGLTVYEAGSSVNIVRDADRWEDIHMRGRLPCLSACSDAFNKLLVSMVEPDHRRRPSATQVLQHQALKNIKADTRALVHLLEVKEKENEELKRRLVDMELELVKYKMAASPPPPPPSVRKCHSLDCSSVASDSANTSLLDLHAFHVPGGYGSPAAAVLASDCEEEPRSKRLSGGSVTGEQQQVVPTSGEAAVHRECM